METVLERIPEMGDIQLTIQISARFNYSALAAKRLVRRFVADEISYLLRVGEPAMVASDRILWRVPVILAFPERGSLGQVGTVDVDVETGRLLLTSEQIEAMRSAALELATRHVAPDTSA